MGFQTNATVVLVPGAWADGSSWGTVINGVAEAGLKVICAPIPLTTLTDDIATVRRVIGRIDGPVLLVAHAYAGAVIAGVDDNKVKGLVYITALAPDEGESTVEVFTREAPHPDAPKMAPDENGYVWMPHEAILKAFSPNASAHEQVRLEAIQRPINVACILEKASAPAWKKKPTWFLIAEEDHMILEKTQRFMAERMKATIRTAKADHIPSLTMPKPVIDIVLEAAASTLAG
ncbi:alpha/beta hydrolase [Tunturiibacter psychrotolerans]|uniref:alpha/beta hydrolase n=1 Tax=Tunturiibacter psychrotolerans TaxID=3069686 RepID=UPI003D24CA7C